jgi:hypothetical protein
MGGTPATLLTAARTLEPRLGPRPINPVPSGFSDETSTSTTKVVVSQSNWEADKFQEHTERLIWNGITEEAQLCRFHWAFGGRPHKRLVIRTFRVHDRECAYLQLNPRHTELRQKHPCPLHLELYPRPKDPN